MIMTTEQFLLTWLGQPLFLFTFLHCHCRMEPDVLLTVCIRNNFLCAFNALDNSFAFNIVKVAFKWYFAILTGFINVALMTDSEMMIHQILAFPFVHQCLSHYHNLLHAVIYLHTLFCISPCISNRICPFLSYLFTSTVLLFASGCDVGSIVITMTMKGDYTVKSGLLF